jgi:hypothetical protein
MTANIPEISVTLCVGGDEFDADGLTRILGIQPTKIWRQRPELSQHLKAHPDVPKFSWNYKLARQPSWVIEEITVRLLSTFHSKYELLRQFVHDHNLKVAVACYIRTNGHRPVLELSAETIKLLAELDATFSIDIEGFDDQMDALH